MFRNSTINMHTKIFRYGIRAVMESSPANIWPSPQRIPSPQTLCPSLSWLSSSQNVHYQILLMCEYGFIYFSRVVSKDWHHLALPCENEWRTQTFTLYTSSYSQVSTCSWVTFNIIRFETETGTAKNATVIRIHNSCCYFVHDDLMSC